MKASINKNGKKARDQKPKGRTDRNWTKLERPRRICSPPQAEFLHFYDEGDASLPRFFLPGKHTKPSNIRVKIIFHTTISYELDEIGSATCRLHTKAQNFNQVSSRDVSLKDSIIRLKNVTFQRDDKVILDDVSMEIERGSIVAIMGPSGVGKTTILRLISGQLRPAKGQIEVNGQVVSSLSRRQLFESRKDIGVLLQNGALFTDLTVFENIATPLREHTRLPDDEIRKRVSEKLKSVGLAGTEELMPQSLSGGMARRVALARAVIMNPKIVLFDEPMTGLDPIATSTVSRLIRETNDQLGLTSIIVTHDVEQMKKLVDYCYIVANAKLIAEGKPNDLVKNENPAVDQFMNGRVDGPISFTYQNAKNNLVGSRPAS